MSGPRAASLWLHQPCVVMPMRSWAGCRRLATSRWLRSDGTGPPRKFEPLTPATSGPTEPASRPDELQVNLSSMLTGATTRIRGDRAVGANSPPGGATLAAPKTATSVKPLPTNHFPFNGLFNKSGKTTMANSTQVSTLPAATPSTARMSEPVETEESLVRVLPTREVFLTKCDVRGAEMHHLHAFCHRHNTHITLTTPKREVVVSLSAGNVGFRKGRRKHYDSAFQLAAAAMRAIEAMPGLVAGIAALEVVLRDFGPGREAFTKVLLGPEGAVVREKITRVTDSSRFKYGGTRSPKRRRLG